MTTDEDHARSRLRRVRANGRPVRHIEEAIEAFRAGKIVIVVDDEDRENEGDLTIASEKVTPEAINFLARYGRGLICLSMTAERLDELQIPLMVRDNTSRFETAFCTPIEVIGSTTTGISASDRAATVLAAIDPASRPADLARPGHVSAARAARRRARARRPDGGGRGSGADRRPVPVGRHLRNHERRRHDGARAGADEVRAEARSADDHHRGPDQYRMRTESLVRRVANAKMPTEFGEFRVHAFENQIDRQTHIALVCGDIGDGKDILVRVHSQCLTGDVFHSVALRLRRAARGRRWSGSPPKGAAILLYLQAGRARHRPGQQDPGVRAPGRGVRHGRGERATRLQGGSARLRHGRADPARAGGPLHAPDEQQPAEARGHRRVWALGQPNGCRSRFGARKGRGNTSRPRRTSSDTSCRASKKRGRESFCQPCKSYRPLFLVSEQILQLRED